MERQSKFIVAVTYDDAKHGWIEEWEEFNSFKAAWHEYDVACAKSNTIAASIAVPLFVYEKGNDE